MHVVHWTLRTLLVAAALFLVIVATDFAGAAVSAAEVAPVVSAPVDPPAPWAYLSTNGEPDDAVCRELVLNVSDRTISGHYDLHLPGNHRLVAAVSAGRAYARPTWFVHDMLGEVDLVGPRMWFGHDSDRSLYPVDADAPTSIPDFDSRCGAARRDNVVIRTELVKSSIDLRDQTIEIDGSLLRPAQDLLTVTGSGVLVDSPEASRPGTPPELLEITRPTRDDPGAVTMRLTVHPDHPRLQLWDWAAGQIRIADPLLWAVGGSVPSALLVWLVAHRRSVASTPLAERVARLSKIVLGLSLASGALAALIRATFGTGLWPAGALGHRVLPPDWQFVDGLGVTGLLASAALVLLPASVLVRPRPRSGRPVRAATFVTGLVTVVAVAWLVTYVGGSAGALWWNGPEPPPGSVGLIATATAYCAFFALVSTWQPDWRAAPVAALSTLISMSYAMVAASVVVDGSLTRFGQHVFTVVASGFVLVLGVLTFRIVRTAGAASVLSAGSMGIVIRRIVGPSSAVLVTASLGSVVLLLVVRPAPTWSLDVWGLLEVGREGAELVDWLGLVLLLALLIDLHRHPLAGAAQSTVLRHAATVYAALVFYPSGDALFYVPVTLLLGLIVVYTFAVPRRAVAYSLSGDAAELSGRLRRDAEALDRRLQKMRPRRKSDLMAYADQRRALEGERQRIHLVGATFTTLRPTEGGGLRHGLVAAAIGGVFGLPWSVISALQVRHWSSDGMWFVDTVIGYTSWVMLQWALFGFFYGYFFPLLRGASGITKALTLFLTVVIPPMTYLAVVGQRDYWSNYLGFSAQMLLYSILLGVSGGDLWMLRRAGLGWQHLFDIHHKRRLLTGAAALALAEAGLLAALVSGLLPPLLEQFGLNAPPSS